MSILKGSQTKSSHLLANVDPNKAAAFSLSELPGLGGILHGQANFNSANFLNIDAQDWYKTFPYQIVVRNAAKKRQYTYTFPIPPENISVQMMSASSVTPTLGGIVEETSTNVLWAIQLSGTTGIAPSAQLPAGGSGFLNSLTGAGGSKPDYAQPATKFRDSLGTTGLLAGAVAGARGILSTASGLFAAGKAIANGDVSNGVSTGIEAALLPKLPYSSSAVDNSSNGYSSINELHRFLYAYSQNKDANPSNFELHFINYKDSQDFRCVIKNVVFQKSASEPYLYKYHISLVGWNPTGPDQTDTYEINRFGPNGDLKTVNTLTITGMASAAGSLKQSITGALKSF